METEIRTDLALEEKERFEGTDVEVSGVSLEKRKSLAGTFQVTMVKILDEDSKFYEDADEAWRKCYEKAPRNLCNTGKLFYR